MAISVCRHVTNKLLGIKVLGLATTEDGNPVLFTSQVPTYITIIELKVRLTDLASL